MPVTSTEKPPFASSQLEGSVGLVEVSRFPAELPATQSTVWAQEIPCKLPGPPGVPSSIQAEGPPSGFLETSIRPCRATATHSVGVPHETPRRSSVSSSWVTFQAAVPPVGLLEVSTLPAVWRSPDTATQSEVVGQSTLSRWVSRPSSSMSMTRQASPGPVGLVEA